MSANRSVLVIAVLVSVAGCTKQGTPAEVVAKPSLLALETIATTRQVMLGITIPTSDVIFQVGNAAPKDDAEWEKVQANAAALAESGNLLMVAPRAVDQEEWSGFSKALIDAAKATQQAAQAHDVEKVLEAGNQVYEVCDGCHKKYMAARAAE